MNLDEECFRRATREALERLARALDIRPDGLPRVVLEKLVQYEANQTAAQWRAIRQKRS